VLPPQPRSAHCAWAPAVQVFLEETSLVARPAIAFDELKARLEERCKWLGIKVGGGAAAAAGAAGAVCEVGAGRGRGGGDPVHARMQRLGHHWWDLGRR